MREICQIARQNRNVRAHTHTRFEHNINLHWSRRMLPNLIKYKIHWKHLYLHVALVRTLIYIAAWLRRLDRVQRVSQTEYERDDAAVCRLCVPSRLWCVRVIRALDDTYVYYYLHAFYGLIAAMPAQIFLLSHSIKSAEWNINKKNSDSRIGWQ